MSPSGPHRCRWTFGMNFSRFIDRSSAITKMMFGRADAAFARYYVVDSLCSPSRTAIMTGEYPHKNG